MKLDKIKKNAVVATVLPIIVLAVFFHFEIRYENVLTGLPETDYEVHIPFLRVVFEPVLGPLLFFNRSIYALRELPLALLWAVILYFGFNAVHVFRNKGTRLGTALRKLGNIPLLLGICFAIFVLVLFIPLPNNTIVNRSKTSVLVTTHAHTEYSHDGLISQKKMWEWHKRNGFDAFFITDHADHKKTLQFARSQRKGDFPIDPLVMVGQEHSGSNHMSLLGLTGKFETKGMEDKAVIDSVHQYGGAVLINHWFDGKGKEKEFYRDLGVDGFEIENVGSDLYYDRAIFADLKKFCETHNLTMLGGLDFHGYGRVCSLYNAFEIPDWEAMDPREKERAVMEILRNGPQEKIKVLMYKDRSFYEDSNLVFRPFLTLIDYFRTLNLPQVLSWIIWLSLFQWITNRKRNKWFGADKIILIASGAATIFLLVLAIVYYVRGEAVKGYSKVYTEYFWMLGLVGTALLVYTLLLGYFRFFKPLKNSGNP